MPTNVTMPALGTISDETKLIEWMVKEGETIKKGQVLFTAESDKATQEVESLESGVIAEIITKPGSMAKTGEVLAVIIQPGEKYMGPIKKESGSKKERQAFPIRGLTTKSTEKIFKDIQVSPKAKKFAKEKGIKIELVKGSGLQGMVMYDDLVNYLKSGATERPQIWKSTESDANIVKEVTGLRASVAKHMMQSLHNSAQVTNFSEVVVDELIKLREALKPSFVDAGLELPYDLLIAKLVAFALDEYRFMNSSWTDAGIVYYSSIHIGIAVDVEGGLIVPVLRNVKERSLYDLAKDLTEKVERAKKNQATTEDLSEGTFTITNIGMYAVDGFTPVINMPQSAVLGIGRIVKKPVIKDSQIIPAYTMTLSLTYDHRIIDGAPAARFLTYLSNIFTNPYSLLIKFL